MIKLNKDRLLVVAVFFIAALIFTSLMLFVPQQERLASMDLKAHPLLGKGDAPVHMVIFEDIQCPGCRVFNERIFPHLKSQYIDTGKMKLTLIPLSLFEGSDLAYQAILDVYHHNPENFFSYFDRVVQSMKTEPISKDLLINSAKEIEEIDFSFFEGDKKALATVLDKNRKDAQRVMGEIETPAIFINGKMVKNISLSSLFYQIEERLEGKTHD
jgi:protein-disulfide isomerase